MNAGYEFERDVKSFDGANFLADVSPNQSSLFGSVTVTNGSTTITGVGTLFNTELKTGDYIFVNGVPIELSHSCKQLRTYYCCIWWNNNYWWFCKKI